MCIALPPFVACLAARGELGVSAFDCECRSVQEPDVRSNLNVSWLHMASLELVHSIVSAARSKNLMLEVILMCPDGIVCIK